MSLQHISQTLPKLPPAPMPTSLHELASHFESVEALENEDAVVWAKSLRFTPEGLLEVPDRGRFAFNPWSRSQLALTLGVKFDRVQIQHGRELIAALERFAA